MEGTYLCISKIRFDLFMLEYFYLTVLLVSSWNAIPGVLWMDLLSVLISTNQSILSKQNIVWVDDTKAFG